MNKHLRQTKKRREKKLKDLITLSYLSGKSVFFTYNQILSIKDIARGGGGEISLKIIKFNQSSLEIPNEYMYMCG